MGGYFFNEDKTKVPVTRKLLWSDDDPASSVAEWDYDGASHGVNLGDFDEFEIVTDDGGIGRTAQTGCVIQFNESYLYYRHFIVNVYLNTAYVGECNRYGTSSKDNTLMKPVKFYGIKVGVTT